MKEETGERREKIDEKEKSSENIWRFQKNTVPLQPQFEKELPEGSLAQLNRASDYGSEGCGFESRGSHE